MVLPPLIPAAVTATLAIHVSIGRWRVVEPHVVKFDRPNPHTNCETLDIALEY
jgi:hypothetical protein